MNKTHSGQLLELDVMGVCTNENFGASVHSEHSLDSLAF